MILDHLDNLTLPDGHHFGNEVAVLQSLAVGLDFLSTQIAGIEKEAWRRFANKARVLSYGNNPMLAWVPKDLVLCAFHWYSVSACNYVSLVGWLAKQVYPTRPEPKEYVRAVIPIVQTYRDKVAAHFARVFPRKDTPATLDASVLPSVTFYDDAFYVGAWAVMKTVQGVPSSSCDLRWSLTKTHAELTTRYWPGPGGKP